MLRTTLIRKLPKPLYRSSMLAGWQNVEDIIDAMKKQHTMNLADAQKICRHFDAGSERQTAQNIFDFLKREIEYRVEPADRQTTKSIPRFLADGYGDCKHFASFTNTIMCCLGYRPVYRFAGYRGNSLTHVYCILPQSNTIVDAVLPYFDTEKKFTAKKDIDMSLYRLSGIPGNYDAATSYDAVAGVNFSKIKSGVQRAAAKSSQAVKKAAASVPALAKNIASTTATATLAIPRNAFLGLVKLNFSGMATDMSRILASKGAGAFSWWKDLGGDMDSIQKAIQVGSTKKRIAGPLEESESFREIFGGYSGSGVYVGEPVTLASAIASATPILIKVKAWMAKNGVDPAKVSKAVQTGKQTFQQVTGKKIEDVVFKKDSGTTNTKMTLNAGDLSATSEADARAIATQAVASAAEVPKEVIREMTAEAESSGSQAAALAPSPGSMVPAIVTPAVPAKPGIDFSSMLTTKNLLIAAAAVLAFRALK